MIGRQNNEKYDMLGTKIAPEYSEVLNKICDVLQVDIYHLIQWFAYTLVRASAPHHELTPEIQKVMTLLESDAGWQHAFNICNPGGRLKVAQCILILEQEGRKGFGAVMIDKPFMGSATMTECVDDILERVTEVTMKGIYRRLRLLGAKMDCQHLSDVLLTMIDAQTVLDMDEENRQAMAGPANYADNGKQYAYGKKTKAKKHRTVDGEANRQQRIQFDEGDRDAADREAEYKSNKDNDTNDDDGIGFRPFGVEW